MRRFCGGLIVVGLLGLSAERVSAGAKSPEDTFKAMGAALKEKNVKAFLAQFTKESQSAITGGMVMMVAMGKAFAKFDKKDGEAKAKIFDEILSKHGLSEDKLADLKDIGKDPKNLGKAMVTLGGLVKDKASFVGDVFAAMPKVGKGENPFKELEGAKLSDVKTDGDRAAGKVTAKKGDMEQTENIYFLREDGVWRVDAIRMMQEKMDKGPK
ncbi:MAG: hypothetical protein U0793_22700 [Gemmataceae bacterium]